MDESKTYSCEDYCFDTNAVQQAKKQMLTDNQVQNIAAIFKALGDGTRVKILHALSLQELCVCDLSQVLGMGTSAVSHQLRVLRGARLVKHRKAGKNVYYTMEDEHVVSLFQQVLEHVRHS